MDLVRNLLQALNLSNYASQVEQFQVTKLVSNVKEDPIHLVACLFVELLLVVLHDGHKCVSNLIFQHISVLLRRFDELYLHLVSVLRILVYLFLFGLELVVEHLLPVHLSKGKVHVKLPVSV